MKLSRVWKTELKDSSGKDVNPVTAFTRFSCAPHGYRVGLAVIRFTFLVILGLLMFIDFGLVDSETRKRAPNDGDYVWFWFRPQDWMHAAFAITLFLMITAADFKRVDSEFETRNPKTYLFIWNAIVLLLPLAASSLIFYYHVQRWDHTPDDTFEATVVVAFVYACLELLWGAWPSEPTDVVLPIAFGVGFLIYTVVMSRVFYRTLYAQLDWSRDPWGAAGNAGVFILTVAGCATFCTAAAMYRNSFLASRRAPANNTYEEVRPLRV